MASNAEVLFKIKSDTDNFVSGMKNAENSTVKMAAGLGAIGLGVGILGSIATKAYELGSNFEHSFAMTSTLINGTTEEINKMRDETLSLSASFGISGDKGAEAMYQLLSAGVDVTKSQEAMASAMKASVASGADLTSVVDIGTTVLNGYGKNADEMDSVLNTLIETQNAGKTTVEELAGSMGKVIPLASSMGIAFEDVSAQLATMTAQGINTAEAVTMQKALFNELGDAGSNVAKILQEQTGKSFQELMAEGKSTGDVLAILSTAADETGVPLNNMFGSVEAGSAALALSGDNADTLAANLDRLTNSTTETDGAFEKMSETTEQQSAVIKEKFNASLTELGLKITETVLPALSWLADHMDILAPILIAVAVAIGVIAVVMGVYTVATTLAAIATNALFLPILLVIGIIALLIFWVVLIYTHWEQITEFFSGLWDKVVEIFWLAIEGIKNVFTTIWEWLKENWKTILAVIFVILTGGLGLLVVLFLKFKDDIIQFFVDLWTKIVDVFNGIVAAVVGAFDTIKNGVLGAINFVIGYIENFIAKAIYMKDMIVSIFSNIMTGISTGISTGIDTLINKVKSMVNDFMIKPLNLAIGTINKIPGVDIPKIPSLSIGTDFVNQDGLAMLHKGEMVVPADVVGGGFTRNGSNSGGGVNIDTINITAQDPKSAAEQFVNLVDEALGQRSKRGVNNRGI